MVDIKSLPPGPIVLTRHGRRHMKTRLLTLVERQRLMAEAAGFGGVTPGDEYLDVVSQVQRLTAILDRVVSPTTVADDPSIVELGDVVTIRHDDGEIERIVLTNPVEAVAADEHVSVRSPLGLALLGRAAGDRIVVNAPQGQYSAAILRRSRAR